MERECRILVVAPEIAHGNPLTAIAISNGLQQFEEKTNYVPISGSFIIPLRRLHQLMTKSSLLSEKYTEGGEKLRAGLAGIGIGLMEFVQWLVNERLTQLRGQLLADVGIFVQEHLLEILPQRLLERLFPKGVFLYIPDVFPKESAIKILKRLKNIVTPFVWNKSAYDELLREGLSSALVAPVLPEGFLYQESKDKINRERRELPQKIVIKTSGSGIGKDLERFLVQQFIDQRQSGQRIEYWDEKGSVIYNDKNTKGQREDYPNLEIYGNNFYLSLLDADVIVSYPSEMIEVVAWLKSQGWQGRFIVLPPRGAHEQRNLGWAKEMRLVDEEVNKEGADGRYTKQTLSPSFNLESLRRVLGEVNLANIILLKKIFDNKIGFSDLFNIAYFLTIDSDKLPNEFITVLKEVFNLIFEVYGEKRRIVNRGLYLRHILKTAITAYQLTQDLHIDEERLRRRIILSTLFHDAFEINKDYNEIILRNKLMKIFNNNEDLINNIVSDVVFLTPSNEKSSVYLERKKQDFDRFIPKKNKPFNEWSIDEKIRFIIKVADVYANLYETVVDLREGKEDTRRLVEDQYKKFFYRVEQIGVFLGEENEFYQRMKKLLEEFKDLSSNIKQIT